MTSMGHSLGNYSRGVETVWCSNPECELHEDGMEVGWEKEFGQSWWKPEECPRCRHHWLQDKPIIEEGDV